MASLIQEKEITSSKLTSKVLNLKPITTAERNQTRYAEGSIIYNKTTKTIQYYDGSAWSNL